MKQKTKKEIEIKLLYRSKTKIISKLGPRMILEKGESIHDVYYGQKGCDMRNINILTRIRKIKNGNAELTCKGKTKDKKNIWHRIELTTKISSPEIMKEILISLGFNKISEYKSRREYWKFNGLEIIFVNFTLPAPLKFMEIEGASEREIRNIVKRLGNNTREVGEEIFKIFDNQRKNNLI